VPLSSSFIYCVHLIPKLWYQIVLSLEGFSLFFGKCLWDDVVGGIANALEIVLWGNL
jgi:hypothetical protein